MYVIKNRTLAPVSKVGYRGELELKRQDEKKENNIPWNNLYEIRVFQISQRDNTDKLDLGFFCPREIEKQKGRK